ncbi:potassium voltage-gated channel protein Shaw-like [Littorina saxatilis]|uniref:potassium voltage-gated channel protein Shaw-like n=1 Tax=Littorina saxatilis TaxID=31220 RepID=UPI0038B62EAF
MATNTNSSSARDKAVNGNTALSNAAQNPCKDLKTDDDNNNLDDVTTKSVTNYSNHGLQDCELSGIAFADDEEETTSTETAQRTNLPEIQEKTYTDSISLKSSGVGPSGRVSTRRDGKGDRVVRLNVGGTVFKTRESTLNNRLGKKRGVKLADQDFLTNCYDPNRDEYFLDRDPEVFRCVLNFLRSGRLHLSASLCGPHIQEELEFYGVSAIYIEPCCWSTFNSWSSTRESLKQLERDAKIGTIRYHDNHHRRNQSKYAKTKIQIWRTLTNPSYSRLAKIYGWVSLLFVTASIFSFCASTHQAFRVPTKHHTPSNVTSQNVTDYDVTGAKTVEQRLAETEIHSALLYLDIVCLVVFVAEYITKVVCSPIKLRYIKSFNGIVDALAISPDIVEFVLLAVNPSALTGDKFMLFMPFLRVMRALRIFRLFRHVPGLWIMIYTLQASSRDLFLMLTFLLVGTLLFASLIFFVDDKETFTSIPHGFWWAIITMTTVGYGDMYPVTTLGYLLGAVTGVCGVLMIGFTIPALVNNFILYYQHVQFALMRNRLAREMNVVVVEREKEEEGGGGGGGRGMKVGEVRETEKMKMERQIEEQRRKEEEEEEEEEEGERVKEKEWGTDLPEKKPFPEMIPLMQMKDSHT